MKLKVVALSSALLLLPFAVHAASLSSRLAKVTRPGEWQTTATSKVEVSGTNMKIPPHTQTVKKCVTQKELDDFSHFTPKTANGMTCKMLKKDLSGSTLTFSMTCSGQQGKMRMDGSTVFQSKDHYTTQVTMQGTLNNMPMTINVNADSKRIGDCTAQPQS